MIIKKAYEKVKSGYTYLDDVRVSAGLSEEIFLLCISELAGQGTIELLPGTELWTEKKGYQVGNETFYGVQWIKETPEKETAPSAFERLFSRITEIAAIMESTDKKKAVDIIKSEFPEFSDMSENTIKTNITSFPFLCKKLTELNTIKQQAETIIQAKDGCLKELDVVKQELNITLNSLETTEQQLNSANQEIASLKQELNITMQNRNAYFNELDTIKQQSDIRDKEMIELNSTLNTNMDTDTITTFMQETEQRFVELNNRIKQLESDKQELKQVKHAIKQRGLNNVGKWNVVESGGYYRAFRNIDGKNVGVYIGKEFTEEKAREKITAKGYSVDD